MSVTTEADRQLDRIRYHIQQAYEIAKNLDSNTWGYGDFKEGFLDDVYDTLRNTKKAIGDRKYCYWHKTEYEVERPY